MAKANYSIYHAPVNIFHWGNLLPRKGSEMSSPEIEQVRHDTAIEWIEKSHKFESDRAREYPARFLFEISLKISEQCSEELKKYSVPEDLISLIECNWILQEAATEKRYGVLSDHQALWLSQELPGMIKAIEEYEPFEEEKVQLGESDLESLRLAPRERQVLEMVTNGKSTHVIANELGIAPQTVKDYKNKIHNKAAKLAAA